MANGEHTNTERREILKDETVPMKIKVGLIGAAQADTQDMLISLDEKIDKIIDAQGVQAGRVQKLETNQGIHRTEIDKLRDTSNRNDVITVITTAAMAVAAFLGIGNK